MTASRATIGSRTTSSDVLGRREERVWCTTSLDRMSLLRATYYGQRFGAHVQETFVFGTNLRGRASCFGAAHDPLERGSLVVIPPGLPHAGRRIGVDPWVWVAAYPSAELLEEILADLTGEARVKLALPRLTFRDGELIARFVRAHDTLLRGHDPLAGESALVEFLAAFLSRYVTPRSSGRAGARPVAVRRAVEYIEEHLADSLSLAEIARVSGYSRYHFLRVFKEHVGQTPFAFLVDRRVARAKRLLRRGAPIVHAAFDCGFADQAHLTRRFKELVGVTPGEFVRGKG